MYNTHTHTHTHAHTHAHTWACTGTLAHAGTKTPCSIIIGQGVIAKEYYAL